MATNELHVISGVEDNDYQEENDDMYLNDVWSMYFHDPNEMNWTNSSYVNLGSISTVDDFWNHGTQFRDHIHKGMFFLMREHVFPYWDDPANIHGGCFSIKVLKDDMPLYWEDMCKKLLCESLLKDKSNWDLINGISTSPKKHFCIIKVWMRNLDLEDAKNCLDVLPIHHGDILFKSNMENISNDTAKLTTEASA